MTPPSRIADDVEPVVTLADRSADAAVTAAGTAAGPDPAPTSAPASALTSAATSIHLMNGGGDLAADLSLLMGTLIRLLRREAPAPVGPGSLAALATVARFGPMRLGDLALREGVAPPTLTRMVAALEESGYVTRRPDPGDRRAVRVSVTDAGAQLVATVVAARAEVFRTRIEAMSDETRQALADAVPALRVLADEPGPVTGSAEG